MNDFRISIKRYLDLKGRSPRREFFLSLLDIVAILIVMYQVALLLEYFNKKCYVVCIFPILIWILVGMCVRRMHDVGKPFYWLLIPVIGFLFMFRDSEATDNKWGLDPKSNYCIDDFFTNEEYYEYLDKRIDYKHDVIVSLFLGLVRVILASILLLLSCYAMSNFEYRKSTTYFDLDTNPVIRIEISNEIEFTDLCVRDVCSTKLIAEEYDSRLLMYRTSKDVQKLKYCKTEKGSEVNGVIECCDINFYIHGYVNSKTKSKKRLKHLVKLSTETIYVKEPVTLEYVVDTSIEYIKATYKQVFSSMLNIILSGGKI